MIKQLAWLFHTAKKDKNKKFMLSNAYILSSEYSTYLSGRCVEIKMLPLSFSEFLTFHDFEIKETNSAFGGVRKHAYDKNGERYELRELFDTYMKFGGIPGIADLGLDQEKALMLLEGIYSTVIMRDILGRENRREQKQITDSILLKKIIMFLADNIGSNISVSSIGNILVNEDLLENDKRKGKPSAHTVQTYVNALLESYFFYEIKRFDIKGKEFLRTRGKYYIVDIGLRNYLLGFRDRDNGHAIENVVYLELLRRGYDVSIGKIGNTEVDFIVTKADKKVYFLSFKIKDECDAIIWFGFTIISPFFAFVCWYAKRKSKPAFMLSILILAVLFNMTFIYEWGYFGVASVLELVVYIIGFTVLRRDTLRSSVLMGTISIVLAFLLNMVIPFHFG